MKKPTIAGLKAELAAAATKLAAVQTALEEERIANAALRRDAATHAAVVAEAHAQVRDVLGRIQPFAKVAKLAADPETWPPENVTAVVGLTWGQIKAVVDLAAAMQKKGGAG